MTPRPKFYYCVDVEWRFPSVKYILLDSPAKYDDGFPPAESFTDLRPVRSTVPRDKKRLWLSTEASWPDRHGFMNIPARIEEAVASVEPEAWPLDITHQLLQMIHEPEEPGRWPLP